MDEHLKRRLVGASVLVALAVIFVPMLLDDEAADTGITRTNIPPRPEAPFTSRIQPLEPPPKPVPLEETAEPEPLPAEETVSQAEAEAPAPAAPPSSPPVAKAPEPAKPDAAEPIASWIVQVGSFSSQENADKLVKELQAAKFSAFAKKAVVGGETLYRVRVGPEVDQKRAQEIQARIEAQFKLKGRVEHYP